MLFFSRKKKEKTEIGRIESIKVLGSGCKSCHALYAAARDAAKKLDLQAQVQYITDMETIMTYGVMRMPALVVNEKVVSAGKVLTASGVEEMLRKGSD